MSTSGSGHGEVIATLTELYTLLSTLVAVPPGAFWLPDPNSNLHAYNPMQETNKYSLQTPQKQ